MIGRKHRYVSLCVEWKEENEAEALVGMLLGGGVRGAEIDEDVDLEYAPSPGIKHEHTVLRLRVRRDYPVWRLLSDVAGHPAVFSVGEI